MVMIGGSVDRRVVYVRHQRKDYSYLLSIHIDVSDITLGSRQFSKTIDESETVSSKFSGMTSLKKLTQKSADS